MKKEFIGFYNPTEEEVKNSWKKGSFAFDANTLLNLYRYSESTRKDFIAALNSIKGNLFLPHQAALEYHSNRISVIQGSEKSYDQINEIIKEIYEKELLPQLNQFKRHPSIQVDQIHDFFVEFQNKVSSELNKQKQQHPEFNNKDWVLDELTNLFENSIGKEFTNSELEAIYKEGNQRYLEKIPPGFKDWDGKKKKGLRHVFGDLIIWKELTNLCNKNKKPLIFITDDRKEDWWTIENGKTIRPREELIKEFFDSTGIRILIYNADSFLKHAKINGLLPEVKEETIEEVKNIRFSDEKKYTQLNDILREQKSISEILSEQQSLSSILAKQKSISEILSEQQSLSSILAKQKSISEILGEQQSLRSILSEQKSISEILGEQQSLSSILGKQNVMSESLNEQSSLSDINDQQNNINKSKIQTENPQKKQEVKKRQAKNKKK